jgi:predicted nucleic acid-binding protein
MLIIYLDTSALLKQYVHEAGSSDVEHLLRRADEIGTIEVTKAEIASAMSRLTHTGQVNQEAGENAWKEFQRDWTLIKVLLVSTPLVERAASLAWKYRLRGYDAVHLAAAMLWQESLAAPVTLATFDHPLWLAARQAGMDAWPDGLAA